MSGLNQFGGNASSRSDVGRALSESVASGGGGEGIPTSLLERRLKSDGDRGSYFFNTTRSAGIPNGPSTPLSTTSSSSVTDYVTKTPSSAMAHRGPYSKPSFLDQRPLSTRFSPYSRKPIFVGARKVTEEDAIEPHLTSTAQRMIEILQRNTTPVVEGLRKVPLHSTMIKTVKPVLTTVKGGPPVTRSPFALDGNPSSLPVPPPYLVPGKVPSQITTLPSTSKALQYLPPPLVKTSPFSQIQLGSFSNRQDFNYDGETRSVGGGKIKGKTTRMHESAARPTQAQAPFIPAEQKPFLAAPAAPAKLPIRPGVGTFTFRSAWPLKSKQKPLQNGLPEESDFWKLLFAASKVPTTSKTSTAPAYKASTSGPAFSALPPLAPPAQSSTWPCPSCLIHNKLSDDKCVCCKEPRPSRYDTSLKIEAPAASKLPSTWSCPDCMVDNKIEVEACVCCTAPRPAKYTSMLGTSSSCASSVETKKEVTPEFKFGFSAPSIPLSTSTSGGTLAGFSFTPSQTTTSAGRNFKFGEPTTSVSESASGGFKFGFSASSSANSAPSPAPFTFGVTTTSVSSALTPSGASSVGGGSGFNFGLKPTAVPPALSSSPITEKSPSSSPMSVAAFRKGFGLSAEGTGTTTANGNTSPQTVSPTSSVKFPVFQAPKDADKETDSDMSKYKFPQFSGGPKPAFFTPSTSIPAPLGSQPFGLQTPQISFSAPSSTTTVSSSPAPISFGGVQTTSPTTKIPVPFVNGIGVTDILNKPEAKPSGFTFVTPATTSSAFPSNLKQPTTTAAVPTSGVFQFGNSSTTAPAPPTAVTTSTTFSFRAPSAPPVATTTNLTQPNFTFNLGESHKRKAPPSEEGSGVFQFNSSEPKLKMRADGPSTFGSGAGGGMKTGSFLDAMKQPGFGLGSVDKPDGTVPPALSINNNAFHSTGNSIGGSGFNNPNAGFQFTGTTAAPPAPTPNFNTGFNFPAPPTSTPVQNNNLFSIGSSQPSTTPQFTPNLVPNMAFTQNQGTSSTTLFTAGASPVTQPTDGRRPAKRAVRRLR